MLIIIVFSQFLFRYAFDLSVSWTQESSRYLLIWLAWISVSYAIKEQRHIRVETIKNLLPEKGKMVVDMIVTLLFSVFAIFLAFIGTQFVLDIKSSGQGSPMMGIPMWVVYSILPLSGVLMVLRLVEQFIFIFKKQKA